jgi:hypothetical protein
MLIDAAQDVADEVPILDGRAQITQRIGHLLHARGVVCEG